MTKEEAIKVWLPVISMGVENMPELKEALDMAIKALEQQSILDKIREEIEQITDTMGVRYNQYVSKIDVLAIIDKYRESDDK